MASHWNSSITKSKITNQAYYPFFMLQLSPNYPWTTSQIPNQPHRQRPILPTSSNPCSKPYPHTHHHLHTHFSSSIHKSWPSTPSSPPLSPPSPASLSPYRRTEPNPPPPNHKSDGQSPPSSPSWPAPTPGRRTGRAPSCTRAPIGRPRRLWGQGRTGPGGGAH